MAARTGKQLAIYLPAELYDRLDASAKRNHRTKTVQVVLALEAFLAADEEAAGIAKEPTLLPEPAPRPKKGKGKKGE
jgi:predicted DNA-binding protein